MSVWFNLVEGMVPLASCMELLAESTANGYGCRAQKQMFPWVDKFCI